MNQTLTIDYTLPVTLVESVGLFASLCSIREDAPTQDSTGFLVDDSPPSYTMVEEDVPCQIGVPTSVFDRRATGEFARGMLTEERELRQVNLNAYFGAINSNMVAIIDGTEYDIVGVVHDSQHTHTSLLVEAARA